MLIAIKKMLYAIFVMPFVRLGSWLRMKWEWRGFATVTQKDWDGIVHKTADKYGESLFPKSVNGDPKEIMIDGKPTSVEFWAKQKIMKELRHDPAFKEARQYLTRAVWSNVPGWGQSAQRPHISAEEAQAIIARLCKKYGVAYEDFMACVSQQVTSGTGKCDNGDTPE